MPLRPAQPGLADGPSRDRPKPSILAHAFGMHQLAEREQLVFPSAPTDNHRAIRGRFCGLDSYVLLKIDPRMLTAWIRFSARFANRAKAIATRPQNAVKHFEATT